MYFDNYIYFNNLKVSIVYNKNILANLDFETPYFLTPYFTGISLMKFLFSVNKKEV